MRNPAPYLLLPLFLALSACAGGRAGSADFKAGYSDGCASANREGGANKREDSTVRDEAAYRGNKDYRSGWGRGFGACRAMTRPSSPGAGPFSTGPIGTTP
jgi:hypothetical protein